MYKRQAQDGQRVDAPQPKPYINLESNPIHRECTRVIPDPPPIPAGAQTERTLPAGLPDSRGVDLAKARASPDPPPNNND